MYNLTEAARCLGLEAPVLGQLLLATGASKGFERHHVIGDRTLRLLYRKIHSTCEGTGLLVPNPTA